MYPTDRFYSKDHEWFELSADETHGLVGITDYAQQQLGDVVYVELPEIGRVLTKGEQLGSIESVKAVSDLFSPVSGEVVEVNMTLGDHPDAVNKTPHDAWMVRIRLSSRDELQTLLNAKSYGELIA